MRGDREQQAPMWSYISPEQRVPQEHPLRPLRMLVSRIAGVRSEVLSGLGRAVADAVQRNPEQRVHGCVGSAEGTDGSLSKLLTSRRVDVLLSRSAPVSSMVRHEMSEAMMGPSKPQRGLFYSCRLSARSMRTSDSISGPGRMTRTCSWRARARAPRSFRAAIARSLMRCSEQDLHPRLRITVAELTGASRWLCQPCRTVR
jgi:hypothetical protein